MILKTVLALLKLSLLVLLSISSTSLLGMEADKINSQEKLDKVLQCLKFYQEGFEVLEEENAGKPQTTFYFKNDSFPIRLIISFYSKKFTQREFYCIGWIKLDDQDRQCPTNERAFLVNPYEILSFKLCEEETPINILAWDEGYSFTQDDATQDGFRFMLRVQDRNNVSKFVRVFKNSNNAINRTIARMRVESLKEMRTQLNVEQNVNEFYLQLIHVFPKYMIDFRTTPYTDENDKNKLFFKNKLSDDITITLKGSELQGYSFTLPARETAKVLCKKDYVIDSITAQLHNGRHWEFKPLADREHQLIHFAVKGDKGAFVLHIMNGPELDSVKEDKFSYDYLHTIKQ